MNADLNNLAEEYWQDELAASPTQALMLGIHDYDELMDDASREAEDARIAQLREYAKAAEAIEPSGLSAQDQITREVLMFEAGTRADLLEMREAELAVNHAMGIQAMLPVIFPQLPIDEPEHAAALLKKYAASGPWFDQMTDRLRSGVAAGRTPVAGTVEKTVAQIDEHLSAAPEKSVFMNVRTPGAFTEEEAAAWRGELAAVVRDIVYPAYRRFRDYIAKGVLPAARGEDTPGICHLEDGEEWYRRAIKRYTSVDLTAEEIHEIGLAQIDKLLKGKHYLAVNVCFATRRVPSTQTTREAPRLNASRPTAPDPAHSS